MSPDEPILLKTFPSIDAAEVAASRLKANGIECDIRADDAGGMIPAMQNQEGVRLMVAPSQLEEARQLLEPLSPYVPRGLEAAEREDAGPESRSRGAGPVFVAFVVGIISTLTWQHFHNKGPTTHRHDLNHDGKPDAWEVWENGYRVEARADRNFDGQVDNWHFYDKGEIVRSEADDNLDGKVDAWWTYTNGYWIDGKRDVDSNGVPDVFYHADSPDQKTTNWRPNGTNIITRRQIIRNGTLSEEFRDSNGKGSFDLNIKYDAFENPVQTNYMGLLSGPGLK